MTAGAKHSVLSFAQLAAETGLARATLRGWQAELALFAGWPKRFSVEDVIAARAVKRFLQIRGATLADARALIELAGAPALLQLGRAPEPAQARSPARDLQDAVRQAAAAGLFGEVLAEVAPRPSQSELRGERENPISLGEARVARMLTDAKSWRRQAGA